MSVEHARLWLRLVAKHRKGTRTLYHRMTCSSVRRGTSFWRWEVAAYDAAYDWSADAVRGPSSLDFRVFVYFPNTDLAAVVRLLKESNDRADGERSR